MHTVDDIRVQIQPVPQKVTALEGAALKLKPSAKVCFAAPEAEKDPAKTAVEDMKAYLTGKLDLMDITPIMSKENFMLR